MRSKTGGGVDSIDHKIRLKIEREGVRSKSGGGVDFDLDFVMIRGLPCSFFLLYEL